MSGVETSALRALALRAQGDDRALSSLFSALYPAVCKHLGFLLGFSALVDDAVQDSMLEIHRSLAGYRGDASPITWALAIASRTARRLYRRELRHKTVEAQATSELHDVVAAPPGSLTPLIKALTRIKPKKREAFVLMGLMDLSETEAGRVLGVSANTARSRFHHARTELRAYVEKADVQLSGDIALVAAPKGVAVHD